MEDGGERLILKKEESRETEKKRGSEGGLHFIHDMRDSKMHSYCTKAVSQRRRARVWKKKMETKQSESFIY